MKKLVFALLAVTALAFVACDEEDGDTVITVDFEDVTLNSDGLNFNDSTSGSIASGDLTVSCTWSWGYCYGFVISNQTDTTDADYTNAYSCIAQSGAGNSDNYAVFCAYYGDSIKFNSPVDMKSVELCNTAYAYDCLKNGNAYSTAFSTESSDYFYVTLTLYNESGSSIGSEDFYLADFTDGNSTIVTDWSKLDLSTYTDVAYIKFSFTSTDMGDWGINTPTYFCIDNIAYYETESVKE